MEQYSPMSSHVMNRKNRVSAVLFVVLLFLGCTGNHIVRAQTPELIDDQYDVDGGFDLGSLTDLGSGLGGIFGDLIGNASEGLAGFIDGIFGNSSDLSGLLDGLFDPVNSTETTNSTDLEDLGNGDLGEVLDFVGDTFGIDSDNLTSLVDGALGSLSSVGNITIDVSAIINGVLTCDNPGSLLGSGIQCLTNLDANDLLSNPADLSNCTDECKSFYDLASSQCPDLVNAIFVGTGIDTVCGEPLPGVSTVPVPTPTETPSLTSPTPAGPESMPEQNAIGIIQGDASKNETTEPSSAVMRFGVLTGLLYSAAVLVL